MNTSNALLIYATPIKELCLATSQPSNAYFTAKFTMTPDSQRCPAICGAQLQIVEDNIFLRLSTLLVANGSGLGPIPVVRTSKDEVSVFGGQTWKSGWNMHALFAYPGFPGSTQEVSLCNAKGLLFTLNICVF